MSAPVFLRRPAPEPYSQTLFLIFQIFPLPRGGNQNLLPPPLSKKKKKKNPPPGGGGGVSDIWILALFLIL